MTQMLGLDLGTTGVKALAINNQGEVLASHTEEYKLHHPQQGWSEQSADDWWEATVKAIKKILKKESVEGKNINGLAFSGQMHGSVFLDDEGEVIRNPILWNDTRTTKQCRKIEDKIGKERLLELVGNPALEGFTAPKVLWLRENEPENYEKLDTLLLPKDYIVYRLTGRRVTENSDAAGTILYDVENQEWSKEVCESLGIDRNLLPEVLDSVDVVDSIKDELAEEVGLPKDTPVVAGGADNACSAVGNGITEEGLFLASIGSSGVVLAHSDHMEIDFGARVHSFNHSVPDKWYLMGVMLNAGLSYRWFRDTFSSLEVQTGEFTNRDPYELLNSEAAQAPPGSGGLIYLPYLNGERTPHKDANARGTFFGFSGTHEKRHFVRSVLEGVTFGLRDSFELIKDMGVEPKQIRATGGGAKSALWRGIQADIFGQEVVTTAVDEGPAYGAALLAGTGSGVFESVENAVDECVETNSIQSPRPENERIYEDLYPVYRSLYTSLAEDYEKLAEFRRKWEFE
ncbi:xylulokinase [Candidatus Bipolaricaulota bacterium]|nr:xylulokinase [Candidatus Bipolaricaulota bacterium]